MYSYTILKINFSIAIMYCTVCVCAGGGLPDIAHLSDGTLKGPYTTLQCRSVRVGSYKVMPKDRVLIVPQGIRIKVPPVTEG